MKEFLGEKEYKSIVSYLKNKKENVKNKKPSKI
jgi:hypothetical protein